MSCVFDKERLTAFFDGELDAAERAETERHISGCSECLRDLGEIKSAASAVKTLTRPRAPRGIAEAVAREIAVAGRVRRIDVWRRRVLWGVSAAAAVLILLNVTYFMTPPDAPLVEAPVSAAPAFGILQDKESLGEGRKELADESAKKDSLNQVEKHAADKRAPADGADHRARRAADAEAGELKKAGDLKKEADRASSENALRKDGKPSAPAAETPLAAKAPAPSAPAKPQTVPPSEPKSMPKTEAPAGGAATPRPPGADAAPKPAEEGRRQLAAEEKSDKAGEARKQVSGDPAAREAVAPLPAVSAYTVRGGKAAQVRAQAEALAKKWSAPAPEAAAKAGAPAPAAPPAPVAKPSIASSSRSFGGTEAPPLVLEVTPEQLEELRKELAAAGVTIEAGAPELLRGAGKDAASGGGALANKERAEQQDAVEAEKKFKTASPTRRITLHFVEPSNLRAKDK